MRRPEPWILCFVLVLGTACGTPFGIYHEVKPGQTLYRIAKVYGVEVERLQRLNRIEDPRRLRPGDLIFVPGARRPRYVPSTVAPSATASRDASPPRRGGSGSGERTTRTASRSPTRTRSERVRIDRPSRRAPVRGFAPIWPVDGQVTSAFGRRDGIAHDGVDIAAPAGAPVRAVADGRVIYSGDQLRGYGNLIIVRHEGCWASVYAHNRENLVRKGEFVRQGQVIARVGATGRASGPHLHFELRCGKTPKDPLKYLQTQARR